MCNPEGIINMVAQTYALPVEDLTGKGRAREVAQARHVAMYLLREKSSCSLSDIGAALGGRNASTVSHACEKIAQDIECSHLLRRRVEDIQKQLRDGA
jgi:chromosomal replication initiator protein